MNGNTVLRRGHARVYVTQSWNKRSFYLEEGLQPLLKTGLVPHMYERLQITLNTWH